MCLFILKMILNIWILSQFSDLKIFASKMFTYLKMLNELVVVEHHKWK